MDIPTRNLSEYVKATGTNLAKMSRDTGIPYISIYDSLANKSRDRDLRAGEFVAICEFLRMNPKQFAEKPAGRRG